MDVISLHFHQEVRHVTSMLEMKLWTQRDLLSVGPRIWNTLRLLPPQKRMLGQKSPEW